MKRFDLQQIMKAAHRTYKYSGKKQGKSFGEVLKMTWKLAKHDVAITEALKLQAEKTRRENEELAAMKANVKVTTYQWPTCTTQEAVYPMNHRGAMGAHFVGD